MLAASPRRTIEISRSMRRPSECWRSSSGAVVAVVVGHEGAGARPKGLRTMIDLHRYKVPGYIHSIYNTKRQLARACSLPQPSGGT